jgi:hypothetical protein
MARERQYLLRLDDVEQARFRSVAKHHEIDVAQLLRKLVKDEEERLGLAPRKKGKAS